MSRWILQISGICWGFLGSFVLFLIIASLIPNWSVLYVATVLGLLILSLIAKNLWQIQQSEGLDLGWFLTVKKGYWRIVVGFFGLILFVIGVFGLILPQIANEIGERHGMKAAYLLVILFWIALTTTFLSLSILFTSESFAFFKFGQIKNALTGFGVGVFFILLSALFLSLFMTVIDENFLRISESIQNWILLIYAIIAIIAGFWNERFEDYSHLKNKK